MGAATGLRPAPLLAGVAAAGVLVATVMTGPDAGAEVRTDRISVDYTCALPTGTQELTATLVQDYPANSAAGGRIQPGPLTVQATVPRGLLPAAATSVSGSATLGVAVADGTGATAATPTRTATTGATGATAAGSAAPTATASGSTGATLTLRTSAAAAAALAGPPGAVTAQWAGLTVAPVPLGATDPTLTATGQVPALTAGRAGTTTTVTPMALALSLQAGGGTLRFQCVPASAPTPLGSVAVLAAPSARAGSPATAGVAGSAQPQARARVAQAQTPECSASPSGTLDPRDLPTPPPGSTTITESNSGVECAYAIGYANVAKLGEASLVNNPEQNPSMALLAIERLVYNYTAPPYYVEIDEVGNLTLPVANATFLSYGFMPTTAKMQLTPLGALTAVETGQSPEPVVTTIYGQQQLRLYDVEVDGTPLDVGSDCHTVTPLQLKLGGISLATTASDPDPTRDYTINGGGPLSQSDLTIPYFTGCGPGGSLDPLFDAAVSGTGNSLNLVQGAPCFSYEGACTTIQVPELPVRAPKTSK
ncbi:hypothetical protein [Streptacidiphilus sp. P02-A3a]|uniref:hypothetical protein n=1 Tax=Streptacidiphilus sp. P02-A3a TaxID=2704468 RepID=UPI0015F8EAA9|nr:hypothetical protein [Streptacidiphilus sp. P02-A3a]QMU71057.1 hypothetical protein GXP74_25370 [Streptacidiphilus sp. P02-A3a]